MLTFKPEALRFLFLAFAIASGVMVAALSLSSQPNEGMVFSILPIFVMHLFAASAYFLRVSGVARWLVLSVTLIVLLSFLRLAWRVYS